MLRDRHTDRHTDGHTDGHMDRHTDGQTLLQGCKDASKKVYGLTQEENNKIFESNL